MSNFLLPSLLFCFALAACADHTSSSRRAGTDGPQAPVNEPDGTLVNPPASGGGEGTAPVLGGNSGGESGTGGQGGAGENGGGSAPSVSGGSGGSPSGGGPSGGPEGGGGSPVPEPGTLLLVGTGLASAALLRRRRQRDSA